MVCCHCAQYDGLAIPFLLLLLPPLLLLQAFLGGMPYSFYHGRTGIVFNVNRNALGDSQTFRSRMVLPSVALSTAGSTYEQLSCSYADVFSPKPISPKVLRSPRLWAIASCASVSMCTNPRRFAGCFDFYTKNRFTGSRFTCSNCSNKKAF